MKKIFLTIILLIGAIAILYSLSYSKNISLNHQTDQIENQVENIVGDIVGHSHHLSLENSRKGEYHASHIVIEETLSPGSNYKRYIASYKSEGSKIYALLTIPNEDRPKTGWPVIIFNHGYIPPQEYRTTERYVAYTDGFSRNGYIVFRSDYRGNGNSEGNPSGAYGSNGYVIDILNAVSSIKKLKNPQKAEELIVDPQRIGMWGHSMGGYITLRNMVINKDIKAGVIWAGVVASYPDLLNNWRRRNPTSSPFPTSSSRSWRQALVQKYGEPEDNPQFWNSISANSYLADISGPIQLHHGTADTSVPVTFSQSLHDQLTAAGKVSEIFIYQGDDHNIASNFNSAMQRSIQFFDKHLKP